MEHFARSDILVSEARRTGDFWGRGNLAGRPQSSQPSTTIIRRRQMLFFEGDPADNIYEVKRGTVKLYKTFLNGRNGIIGFFGRGGIIGFSIARHYGYSAETVTDVEVLRSAKSTLSSHCSENPKIAWRLLEATCGELETMQEKMFVLCRKNPIEKVAWFLLECLPADDSGNGSNPMVELPMSRADIADYLGMAPETLCRTLTHLKKDGVIFAETPYRIKVCDVSKLETIAADVCN